MAGDAGLGRCGVIKATHKPVGCSVANLAGLGGGNMRCTLSAGNHTIVTTFTGTQHLGMIDQGRDRRPNDTRVTGLANVRRRNMGCRLAGSRRAIVTGDAGIRGRCVIKGRHQPGAHQMANLTRLGGGHMSGALTDGNHTVMA